MKRALLVLLLLLLVALAAAKLILFELPRVAGADMAPALQPGDLLLAYRFNKEPLRGQLVLLEHPDVAGRVLLRRVVGIPGDRVSVRKEVPYLNGEPLPRRVVDQVLLTDGGQQLKLKLVEEVLAGTERIRVLKDPGRRSVDAREVTLEGAYYVLADNRNHGTDSRTFGPVPAGRIRAVITHRISAGPGIIEGQRPREGWVSFSP